MTAELNKKTERIRGMIDQRLKAVSAAELINAPARSHVDEDTIAAFVEGRLADDECQPVVSHLAACGLCRRTSAQFVQLENQIETEVSADAAEEEPGRLEALISRLGSVVPSASEEVVFAYEDSKTGDSAETNPTSDSESSNKG